MVDLNVIKTYVKNQGFELLSVKNFESSKDCRVNVKCPNGHYNETSWNSFAYQKKG